MAHTVVWGAAVLLASAAFFVLVERPCMVKDWPARLARRVSGRAVTTAGVVVPALATEPLASNQPVP